MATITLDGVTSRYPVDSKYDGVTDVSFSVDDGEYFALVGPSDAGLSSVLRLIAGLDELEAGTVSYDGEPMDGVPANERDASILFETLALYPNRTGFENIEHPLKASGVPKEERETRVADIADRLNISHLLDRTPETFSGGEKQRVGLARTLIDDSEVYLLNEPLGGLDAKLRRELRVLLKRLHEHLDKTFIHATQNQAEAMSVADRIAVLDDGRIQQIGEPTELYDRPTNRFVAEYIGNPKINFVEGRVGGGTLSFGPFEIPTDRLPRLSGETCTVGIRPHDATLVREHRDGAVPVTVDVTEPQGSKTIVDVDCGAFILRTISRDAWAGDLSRGDDTYVSVDSTDVYLIDQETEAVVYCPPRDDTGPETRPKESAPGRSGTGSDSK